MTGTTDITVDGGRLVVVSNRLPLTLRRTGDVWNAESIAGGLASALEPVLRRTGGLWMGWPGDAPKPQRLSGRKAQAALAVGARAVSRRRSMSLLGAECGPEPSRRDVVVLDSRVSLERREINETMRLRWMVLP